MSRKKRFFAVIASVSISVFLVAGISYAAAIDAKSELGGADGDFFDFKNTTLEVGSLRVGSQGSGGVTFFNGSIVNDTTTYGHDNPVTIADNLRVDGGIQRGHNFPSDNWGVKILDSATVYGGLIVNEHASFGQDVTIAGSFNSSDADAKYASKGDGYTKSEADAKYASKGDGYTKSEADAKFATQAATDIALLAKANSADVYAKSVLYTQTQIDNFLASKAETSDVYTQAQVDALVDGYVPEAQTEYFYLNAYDLSGFDNTTIGYTRDANSNGVVNNEAGQTIRMGATVNIPDGATVTQIDVDYIDDSAGDDFIVNFSSQANGTAFLTPIAVINDAVDSSSVYTASTSLNHTVDTSSNTYSFQVSIPRATEGKFLNAKFTYTTPTY